MTLSPFATYNRYMKRAFTLIELLIVITIIGIVVGLATIAYVQQAGNAQNAKIKTTVNDLGKAMVAHTTANRIAAPELVAVDDMNTNYLPRAIDSIVPIYYTNSSDPYQPSTLDALFISQVRVPLYDGKPNSCSNTSEPKLQGYCYYKHPTNNTWRIFAHLLKGESTGNYYGIVNGQTGFLPNFGTQSQYRDNPLLRDGVIR